MASNFVYQKLIIRKIRRHGKRICTPIGLACVLTFILAILFVSSSLMAFRVEDVKMQHIAKFFQDSQKFSKNSQKSSFFESVSDCITKQPVGTGITGIIRTERFTKEFPAIPGKASDSGELRNASQESFRKIFADRAWGKSDNLQGASGPGSLFPNVFVVMLGLHEVVKSLKEKLMVTKIRVLDVPCGDMVFMSLFLLTRDDISYTGIDIVPELIESHKKTYADKPYKFVHVDIIKDGFGSEEYDLVFSRFMLQHLLNSDVKRFLYEVSESGSHYLLTTSFPTYSRTLELDITSAFRFRNLNLEVPPINLAPPLCYFKDWPESYVGMMLYALPLRQVIGCTKASMMKLNPATATVIPKYYSCGNWSI